MHPNMVGLSPERGFLQHNLERATQSCRAASLNAATSYSCQWLLQATRLLTLRPASPCPGPARITLSGTMDMGFQGGRMPKCQERLRRVGQAWTWCFAASSSPLRREEGLGLGNSPTPTLTHHLGTSRPLPTPSTLGSESIPVGHCLEVPDHSSWPKVGKTFNPKSQEGHNLSTPVRDLAGESGREKIEFWHVVFELQQQRKSLLHPPSHLKKNRFIEL